MSGRQRKDRAAWQAYVRSHPVRRAILTLYEEDENRSLAAGDLLRELGEAKTTFAVVAYHVRVLKDAGLLPDSKPANRRRRVTALRASAMTRPDSHDPMEFRDSEESELRAFAELQGFIRYEEEACKLEEERQQAEERRAKAWKGLA